MIYLSLLVVVLQLVNREYLVPRYRDLLTSKPGELEPDSASAMLPSYDKSLGILIEGDGILATEEAIKNPSFRLYSPYGDFGDVIAATQGTWRDPQGDQPAGYLLSGITRPTNVDELATAFLSLPPSATEDQTEVEAAGAQAPRAVLFAPRDTPWLNPGECFVATTLNPEVLRDNPRSTRMAAMPELIRRVRNAAVHSSDALKVMLHERLLRPPLDFCLVLLGLPLVVNRKDKRLFSMIAQAMGLVLLFFGVKTVASGMGGSGYMLTPAMAAWVPLLILGPVAFVRYRDVQLQ